MRSPNGFDAEKATASNEVVTVELRDDVAVVTLARPGCHNAIDSSVVDGLLEAISRAERAGEGHAHP